MPPIGAVTLLERALAPDLARGAMLLLIALANVPLYLYGEGHFGSGLWVPTGCSRCCWPGC